MVKQQLIGKTTFTMPSDNEIVATRVFAAGREMIWDVQINPKHLPQWLLGPDDWSMPVCEIDLRVGGEWRYVWHGPDGEEMEMRGIYREIVPPERLVNTESWGEEWPETLNTMILTEEDGKTKLEMTMLYPSPKSREAAIATGMLEGWSVSYDRLDEYLATGFNN